MRKARRRKETAHRLQEEPDTVSVWHPGAVDPHPEYQSFGIDEQMTLSAFDLLGRVEAALVTPYPGGPDRL